jgi:hypothetical protein
MEPSMKTSSSVLSLIAMTGLLSGCAATKPAEPVTVENVVAVSATVEAVDVEKRLLSLRAPDGKGSTIEVPAEVRNLAQVKVGDQLVVRYYESIGAAMKPKGTAASSTVEQAAGLARAEPGAKPGASVGSVSTMTVVIQSVDKKSHTVMFSGPDGFVRVVPVKDPAAQKFVDTLKEGDEVELTYTEALAISVEAAK